LQTTPFLKNLPERYEVFSAHFDLCLLEFSEGDMARAGDLMDRIAPLMKAGGQILMVVYNKRVIDDATGFGAGVAYHGRRLVRPSAWLSEVYFVPASRLRWALHRAWARLGGLAHRRPWIGIPATAFFGGLLALLTFVCNFLAAGATKAKLPRGIISSVLMVLRVRPTAC
jgi:hypothetical protein